MARSDNLRPSQGQIRTVYECTTCGQETEIESGFALDLCACGGQLIVVGESYPADSSEWDEEFVDGDWRRRS